MLSRLCLSLVMTLCVVQGFAQDIFQVKKGTIRFYSDAPQELINAESDNLKGVIDIKKKTFAFKIDMASFIGFNSPLQKEHFNENYIESAKYPDAVFQGKIIENIDLTKDGKYNVRAKGKMNIHGMAVERIIDAELQVKNEKITIHSVFVVPLLDHDIKIPRVVYDKLAMNINVSVDATLIPRQEI